MGTSASFPTPSGGDWTAAKQAVTKAVKKPQAPATAAAAVVAATLRALGGLQTPGRATSSGSDNAGQRPRGGTGRGGRGAGAAGGGPGRTRTASRAVAGIGGFGAAVRDEGLAGALKKFGLAELQGKPAAEVVSRVAEHLAEEVEGLQHDNAYAALLQAIYDSVQLTEGATFEELAAGLEGFLAKNGPEGLASLFLAQYLFGRVWTAVENHASSRTRTNGEHEALLRSVLGWCREQIRGLFEDYRNSNRFDKVDWFGEGGLRLADELCDEFESRLAAAAQEAEG